MDLHSDISFSPGKTRIHYGGAYTDHKDFAAIQSVLDRNWWTIDREGKLLEKELAEFTNTKHAVLTNSGSSALLVAFASLKLEEGSEIITGAVQFPTAISSLYYNRLTPVFVDVDETFLIDPDLIEQAITSKTRAILAVSIAGNIPNIDRLKSIANKHNLLLVLDNCDGFGGTWNEKPLEKYFDISATSFHAAHILCMGEGGAIFTNDSVTGNVSLMLREWGRMGGYDQIDHAINIPGLPDDYPARYIFQHLGFNLKPLELQCAMGRTQLQKLPDIKQKRSANFNQLREGLENISQITLPKVFKKSNPSWFGFPMLVENRAELREFLEARQIETRTIFGGNITRQPAFKHIGRIASSLSNADMVMKQGMFISVHPSLTSEMIQYMIDSINSFYAS